MWFVRFFKNMLFKFIHNEKQSDGAFAKNELFEQCVVCCKPTNIKKNCPISDRDFYVEGVGQMCFSCHRVTYSKENPHFGL